MVDYPPPGDELWFALDADDLGDRLLRIRAVAAREGSLRTQIVSIMAGMLAVAAQSPARAPSRSVHRSIRSTPKRRSTFDLSEDVVASLHAFVLRRVPDRADAADIAQQALLFACTCQRGSRRIANVDAWLRGIARHLIMDHFRAGNRYSTVVLGDVLADSEPVLRTRPDLPVAIWESRERLRSLLDETTGQLCLVHQIALLLADVYGHCDKHAATLLQMSVPCYKLVLHRARSAVRASRTEPPHAAASLGVTCYLSRGQLVALRSELLEGLMT